jgi:hypothetical protein
MPYITTERVAEIRAELKKEFPDFKFSIVREHHSSIIISILEAPLDFGAAIDGEKKYDQVNVYHIASFYEDQPEVRDALLKIYSIANRGNYTVVEDSDYGSIPSFYCDINIGKWDKPFIKTELKQAVAPIETKTGEVSVIEYSEKAIAVIGDTYPIKEKLKEAGGKFNNHLDLRIVLLAAAILILYSIITF